MNYLIAGLRSTMASPPARMFEQESAGARSMNHDRTSPLRSRPMVISIMLMLATIAAGLAIRFAHLGLPRSVVKYGGSMLWAVDDLLAGLNLLASWRLTSAAAVSGLIAAAVEFLKLYHTPWLDVFRRTLPGIVLLGSIFSFRDIAAYWIAIGLALVLDWSVRRMGFLSMRKSV